MKKTTIRIFVYIVSLFCVMGIMYLIAQPEKLKPLTLSPPSQAHIDYLQKYDWNIKKKTAENVESIQYYPERHQTLQLAGLNLQPFQGHELTITTYLLTVKQADGLSIYATIYEQNGEIIGATGRLEDWVPGLFDIKDKNRLIEDGIILP